MTCLLSFFVWDSLNKAAVTAQKTKFSIKDFDSKYDQIRYGEFRYNEMSLRHQNHLKYFNYVLTMSELRLNYLLTMS